MKIRIITSIIALFIFASVLLLPEYIFAIAFMIIAYIAIYEFNHMIKKANYKPYKVIGYISALFIPLSAVLYYFYNTKEVFYSAVIIYLLFTLLIYICWGIIFHTKYKPKDIIMNYFSVIYLIIPIVSIVFIRYHKYGIYNIMYIFIGAWITDTFAYFSGRIFGKRKLALKLSPKKTIAGAIGGICGTVCFILAYGIYLNYNVYENNISYFIIILLGIFLSVISQIGDLFASYLKREANIKDFGNIMPGHGGILDRFDSIFLVIPAVLIFVILMF